MKNAKQMTASVAFTSLVVMFLSSAAYSQQKAEGSQREALIRSTYGKLTVYNGAANAQDAADRNTPYKQADDLIFELRNMRTGPIRDIYSKSIGEMVEKPVGDIVSVGRAIRTFNNGPEHVMYRAKWEVSGYKGSLLEDWESTSIERMLELTGSVDVAEYTSYEVTVRLAGKERTYRAMALYHDSFQSAVEPRVDFLDNVVGQGALTAAFMEKRPLVKAPWFEYVKSDAYRAYLEAQRKAIANPEKKNEEDERDQETDVSQSHSPSMPEPCSSDVTFGPEAGKYKVDYTYHAGPLSYGQHDVRTAMQGVCLYDQNCYVRCTVSDTNLERNEYGFPSSACHQSGWNILYEDKTAPAMEGASCSTTIGVGFKACLFCQCSVSVSITPISVSSDGFWTYQHKLSHSCPCLH